jgi:hypothetical protein
MTRDGEIEKAHAMVQSGRELEEDRRKSKGREKSGGGGGGGACLHAAVDLGRRDLDQTTLFFGDLEPNFDWE